MSATAEALHQAIGRAHRSGDLVVDIDLRAVSRAGAPGFRTTDIVVPPFFVLVLSAYLLAAAGPIAGAAGLLIGFAVVYIFVRPWNRRRTEVRVRQLALARLEDWKILWQLGGLDLYLTRDSAIDCVSPTGNWQAFVGEHLLPAPAETPPAETPLAEPPPEEPAAPTENAAPTERSE